MFKETCPRCFGTGVKVILNFQRTVRSRHDCVYCDGKGFKVFQLSQKERKRNRTRHRAKEVAKCAKYRIAEKPEKAYDPYSYDIS